VFLPPLSDTTTFDVAIGHTDFPANLVFLILAPQPVNSWLTSSFTSSIPSFYPGSSPVSLVLLDNHDWFFAFRPLLFVLFFFFPPDLVNL